MPKMNGAVSVRQGTGDENLAWRVSHGEAAEAEAGETRILAKPIGLPWLSASQGGAQGICQTIFRREASLRQSRGIE